MDERDFISIANYGASLGLLLKFQVVSGSSSMNEPKMNLLRYTFGLFFFFILWTIGMKMR
jgi:hypothetical protein